VSNRRIALLVLLILLLLALGLGGALAWHSYESSQASTTTAVRTPTVTAAAGTTPGPGECHSINGLPDPTCTRGVADPRVTQDNIITTICVSGYTTKVRPSSRYTDALEAQQIKAYGYTDTTLADYEEDHLIPLEIGGHPTDPKNLWPEPRTGAYPATKKDGVENSVHTKVCAGLMTLAAAQAAIAANWESLA
jgi:hypothetical protein